jgi:hypothetical protein
MVVEKFERERERVSEGERERERERGEWERDHFEDLDVNRIIILKLILKNCWQCLGWQCLRWQYLN